MTPSMLAFKEIEPRIWQCGEMLLTQAHVGGPYELWGIQGSSGQIAHRYHARQFETMDDATDFINQPKAPPPTEVII